MKVKIFGHNIDIFLLFLADYHFLFYAEYFEKYFIFEKHLHE